MDSLPACDRPRARTIWGKGLFREIVNSIVAWESKSHNPLDREGEERIIIESNGHHPVTGYED